MSQRVADFFNHKTGVQPRRPFLPAQPYVGKAPSRALPAVVQALLDKPVSFFEEMATRIATPTDEPLTNVAFILDDSSSMEKGLSATIEGFNNQVNVVRKGARDAGRTTFTETHFSSTVRIRRVAAALETLQPLTDESYVPHGWTALYDALGDTIAALLDTEGIDAPLTATLVTLFTDGGENYSTTYSGSVLGELIKRLEATKRWTFALVGPEGGVRALGDLLAVKKGNITGYNPDSVEDRKRAFGLVASASASYMTMRSTGMTQAVGLYQMPGSDK